MIDERYCRTWFSSFSESLINAVHELSGGELSERTKNLLSTRENVVINDKNAGHLFALNHEDYLIVLSPSK